MLIVLDQFEQWLHAKKDEENTELVQALRQCDGGRVQCIVMVRDDFWLAVSRFMQALEIRLRRRPELAGWSISSTSATPAKVLAAFGRAFGRLPDNLGQCTQRAERVPRSSRRRAWPRKARSSRCGWPCSPR